MGNKTVYEQLCEDFRSLNGFLWQMPVIMMTLTGGLWFAVYNFHMTTTGQTLILGFTGIANVLMTAALIRLRFVMHSIQKKMFSFDGRTFSNWKFFIVAMFSLILLLAAGGSLFAAFLPNYFLSSPSSNIHS